MHGLFCPIRLIHLIGRKSLHFEKTSMLRSIVLSVNVLLGRNATDTAENKYTPDPGLSLHVFSHVSSKNLFTGEFKAAVHTSDVL